MTVRMQILITAMAMLLMGGGIPIQARAGAPAPNPPAPQKSHTLAVLNPVDLANSLPDPETGSILRMALAKDARWKVTSGEAQYRTLRENGINPDSGCAEFQCGFNAGNALQAEFLLFGTVAALHDTYTYTLCLVHVPTSQIIWTHVGDVARPDKEPSGRALQQGMMFAVTGLDPSALLLRRPPTMGLMAVMDAGKPSFYSRIAMQRALSKAYGSRAYDLMGPAELNDLLGVLDLHEHAVTGEGEDMLSLGTKMGVHYLLWTQVDSDEGKYKLEVSLYDVPGKKLVRHWPTRESRDFENLLGIEDRFLTVLGTDLAQAQAPFPLPKPHQHWKTFGKIASVGLALATGGALGYLAFRSKQAADNDFQSYQSARTEQEASTARLRVSMEDSRARNYGVVGGVSLALGMAVWAF